ncbi:CHAT domain-containing protein [Salinispora arenicola]|uniref:CHAT domain-containing protein n=1 Tax=Salinispora arenicola TaxID=168697 RepID=UPI001E4E2F61|nr:CHAT domain-containing tetratricopeptide repeat protein [Salinispora arenicola]
MTAPERSPAEHAVHGLLQAQDEGDDFFDTVRRLPNLLTVEAEQVLDRLIAATGAWQRDEADVWAVRLRLERLRRALRDMRVHGVDAVHADMAAAGENPAEAMEAILRRVNLRDKADLGKDPALLAWREGQVLQSLGRTEEAISHFERAAQGLRARDAYGMEGDIELTLWQLKRGDRAAGDLEAAVGHAERAEAAYRKIDDRDALRAALVALVVDTALPALQGDRRSDVYLARLAEIDAGYGEWFRSYLRGAELLWSDPAEAETALRRCMDTVGLLGDGEALQAHWRNECARKLAAVVPGEPVAAPSSVSALDHLLASARSSPDQPDVEVRHLDQALRIVEEERRGYRSEVTQRALSASRAPIYLAAAEATRRAGRDAEALDILERNTSRSLLTRMATHELWADEEISPRSTTPDYKLQAIRYLTEYERHAGNGGSRRQLRTSLARLRESLQRDDEELLARIPSPRPRFEPTTAAAVSGRLVDDDIVLVYAPIGEIYSVTGDGATKVASFDVEAVEKLGAEYRRLATSVEHSTDEATAAVTSACIDPIRAAVAGRRRVMIVPYGALWNVPLAVMDPQPLAADHRVSYVPSLSVLLALLDRAWPERRLAHFVGVADPDGSLPHAAEEVSRSATNFYNPVVHIGANIDMPALLADLTDADLVHLACHGLAFDEFPELPALHLSGSGAERQLWAPDIVRMSLQARLVVLAACHAGLSQALPGNEYLGLPGVFLSAGARTVLGPLWKVDDRSTAVLMDHFYRRLPEAGPAQALFQAQQALRTEPTSSHPYHWAAFQLFGLS